MPNLVIFGASDFGEEIAQLVYDINQTQEKWKLLGFLDDNESLWAMERSGIPVLGGRAWLAAEKRDLQVVIAIGNVRARKIIATTVEDFGYQCPPLIHPSVLLANNVKVGNGSLICARSILSTHVSIGNHTIINMGCIVGHNSQVGTYTTVNPHTSIAGGVKVGESVYIGIGATVIDKVMIQDGATIGAGSAVMSEIPENTTAIGVPARVMWTKGG